MQEPGRDDRKEQRAAPPIFERAARSRLESVAQRQADGGGRGQGDQGRGGAGDKNALAEEQGCQNVHVNGEAQAVFAAVLEEGWQEVAGVVAEVVAHQVVSQHGVDGFVGEEVDGPVLQPNQAGEQVDEQPQAKQQAGQGEAAQRGSRSQAAGRRLRIANRFDNGGNGRGSFCGSFRRSFCRDPRLLHHLHPAAIGLRLQRQREALARLHPNGQVNLDLVWHGVRLALEVLCQWVSAHRGTSIPTLAQPITRNGFHRCSR